MAPPKMIVLLTVILMDLLSGMEFDLFVPSFPELQSQFMLSPFWVEALLSVNFVGYCIGIFLVGNLSDYYGRKPLIAIGLIIFTVGSIACLWAPHYSLLLVGRLLQGLGVAAPSILSFLIIADAYPIKKQQFYMAILNAIMNIAIAVAPVMGSYVTLHCHWQGNFVVLLLLGLVALVMTWLFIPQARPTKQYAALAWTGYLPIFQSKPMVLLLAFIITSIVPYWIFVGMSPLLYMKDLGVSLEHFGYYQGVLALVFALGSMGYGFIINRYDQKRMLYVSWFIFIAGFLSMASVTMLDSHSPLWITLSLLPFIIGQVIPTTVLFPLCLNYIPEAKGRVASVIQGTRLILSAVSLQLASYYYQGSFQNIGYIMLSFIFLVIISMAFTLKNSELMKLSHQE